MTSARKLNYAKQYMLMIAVRNCFIEILTEAFGGHSETFNGVPEAEVIRKTVDRLPAVDPNKMEVL